MAPGEIVIFPGLAVAGRDTMSCTHALDSPAKFQKLDGALQHYMRCSDKSMLDWSSFVTTTLSHRFAKLI